MNKEKADQVIAIAENNCIDAELYDNDYDCYSGRGMYGSSTTGIVVPGTGSAKCLDELMAVKKYKEKHPCDDEDDTILEELRSWGEYPEEGGRLELQYFRIDNLGKDYIIY